MTARNLNRLLEDKITVDAFKASIEGEFQNYQRLMEKRGSTIDLRFLEDEEVQLDKLRLKKLINLVVADRLTNIHLAYICDCLTLTEELNVDEETKELIYELADPEINGGYADKRKLAEMVSRID
jgi:hypothetical protein